MSIFRMYPVSTFDRDLTSALDRANGSQPGTPAGFQPPVDIFENQEKVILALEVPGVKAEDLDVQIDGNTLTVKGERKNSTGESKDGFQRIERRFGSFSRSFTLPKTIDTAEVGASLDEGILTLTLTKKPEAKPRQVKVLSSTQANQPAAA